MSRARRVELRVVAIGGTLPQNLTDRLLSATYTDNEEDAADDLQISYDNAANEGNKQWLEVKATIAPPDTGKLVQKEVAPTETIDYIVQRGDTLSAIAAKYLGSASKYNQIVQISIHAPRVGGDGMVSADGSKQEKWEEMTK